MTALISQLNNMASAIMIVSSVRPNPIEKKKTQNKNQINYKINYKI